ncbi:hypothetical protein [Avibacterium paragallinarum]|uniref:Uncharacterized protein n=1 Tax=Avibacterium paragallinarum TaxID=728 RepID=A0A380X5B3_AVIPA|nr:hypothetical protein [Avibacterium paragallinarum]SUU98310.1 Uncharacterised protein [Avibacterium paragallinarum]
MKKLAFAGALFAFAATNVNAIDVVSKDGKVDFGSRFEATVLTKNVDWLGNDLGAERATLAD